MRWAAQLVGAAALCGRCDARHTSTLILGSAQASASSAAAAGEHFVDTPLKGLERKGLEVMTTYHIPQEAFAHINLTFPQCPGIVPDSAPATRAERRAPNPRQAEVARATAWTHLRTTRLGAPRSTLVSQPTQT